MRNTESLQSVYCEAREMNKNLQRLLNIGILGLILNLAKKSDDAGKWEKLLLKIAAVLVAFINLLLVAEDISDIKRKLLDRDIAMD